MRICSISADDQLPIGRKVSEPMAAWQPFRVASPKLARGSTPRRPDGASAIHSAELRCAPAYVCVVVARQPWEELRLRKNWLFPRYFTSALMKSPAATG